MAQFKISVDLRNLGAQARGVIDETILPRLNQAVGAVAQQASIDWKEAVGRSKLWSGEKTPYAESITWRMTGSFTATVESDYRYAAEIDTGRPARDMKTMLNTSLKVRTTKTGKRFLIIPFRHSTPGNDAHGPSMPTSVHELARQLAPSRVSGMGRRVSGTGAMDIKTRKALTVPQRKYVWGGQLSSSVGSRYAGMVRMRTSSGKQKSSAYMTFRVMMEGSPGWIIPAKPGLYLVKGVTERLQPLAERAFTEAIKRDLG